MTRLARSRALAVLVAAVTAADWLSKFWVQNRLPVGDWHTVVDGWVFLTHRRNTGVAFSAFAGDATAWRVGLLALASLVGIAVCVHLIRTTRDRPLRYAAALVLAGALGNLGDRLLNGAVTDFILVSYFPFVFNVADVAITVGAVLLALRMGAAGREGPPEPTPA
ncbi:MAG TPA: signal peptidase II [Longimicrobiaceae bacterium]|nr:signal peptidase II [Longimicrobiaceae bacterium]